MIAICELGGGYGLQQGVATPPLACGFPTGLVVCDTFKFCIFELLTIFF